MSLFRCFIVVLFSSFLLANVSFANDTADSVLRLLVLGDSLAAGYGLPADESFPAQLEKALKQTGHQVKVINAGVSGDTTSGGLSRLSWALADSPQLVLVELGANDALRGLPPEQSFANLDAILARLSEHKVQAILLGMQAPRNMGQDYVRAFDSIYQRLAKKHAVALYPFFLEGVALIPNLNQSDGIHPNADGVKVIVSRILPLIQSEINSLVMSEKK